MASVRVCDRCRTAISDTNPIIAKLYLTPVKPQGVKADHGAYTAHADIGECCKDSIGRVKWQKRKTRERKSNGRKLRP